ncbi:hypothetical protein GCM10010260_12980 [Streptomyces filipinensis]|uniref:Uncharacterized protein n=1 Tax=Streptomyces filipinensis TaxID=66887 RepID=A0A918M914_9ACTN|nr:hypothetical protein [Streptomyces filipinensis]GGU81859.1 hypothetical protein GCM10010260_12980 [Streptomyces filipinensis]
MPSQHPEEVGYGHAVESYVTRMYGGLPRYLVLGGSWAPVVAHHTLYPAPDR